MNWTNGFSPVLGLEPFLRAGLCRGIMGQRDSGWAKGIDGAGASLGKGKKKISDRSRETSSTAQFS